jgi:hypothetical protein
LAMSFRRMDTLNLSLSVWFGNDGAIIGHVGARGWLGRAE